METKFNPNFPPQPKAQPRNCHICLFQGPNTGGSKRLEIDFFQKIFVHTTPHAAAPVKMPIKDPQSNRNFQYNILVTYLLMRFATNSPASIKTISEIIQERHPSNGQSPADRLKSIQFWTEKLLPHLHNCSQALSAQQSALIT